MLQNPYAKFQDMEALVQEPYYCDPVEVVDGTIELDGKIILVPSVFVIPDELKPQDRDSYQVWSGFVPPCTLKNQAECVFVPVQTANIKVNEIYSGIERQSDFWMDLACSTAFDSVGQKGGPFGAVILQIDAETKTIIRMWQNHNQVTSIMDPTAHAEVMTIRSACRSLGVFNLGQIKKENSLLDQPGDISYCVIYSSAEPCPMCYSAICWANMPTLLFAATRFDAAVQGVNFSDEEIYNELNTPYSGRNVKVYQCTSGQSLDAFNTWKRSEKTNY